MRFPLPALLGAATLLIFSVFNADAALTTSYIVASGVMNSTGTSTSPSPGVYTLGDSTNVGDIWNGGDTFTYLHEDSRITGNFTATVRIVGQSEAANGRWGKAGINVRNSLDANSSGSIVYASTGNDSQPGGSDPVPVRISGRPENDGVNGFEVGIPDGAGGNVPSDVFRTDGEVNTTWLSISFDAATNGFQAGFAPDVNGAPGAWLFSEIRTDVTDTDPSDGWYVGLAYSAHSDLSLGTPAAEGIHEVTFDNFSIAQVPEPTVPALGALAFAVFAFRRRRA